MTKLEEQLINQNAKLLTLIEQLTAQNKQLSEQVKLLNQKLFGRSSEKGKTSKDPDENQLSLFQEVELNILNEAESSSHCDNPSRNMSARHHPENFQF